MARRTRRVAVVVIATCSIGLSACATTRPSIPAVTRTVAIDMTDLKFTPAALSVRSGQAVRFKFHNADKTAHEAFIGDARTQREHASAMADSSESTGMAGMRHGNAPTSPANGGGLTLMPDEDGQFVFVFGDPGSIAIACHEPGHYEAGMRMTIKVT